MGKSIVLLLIAPVVVLALGSTPVWANVYASGMEKIAPDSLSYVLNEAADTGVVAEVWQVGGGKVYSENLGAQAAGTHTWAWNGTGGVPGQQYTVKIKASSSGHSGWTQISTDGMTTSFWSPLGISVNKHQWSPNFGKVYVSNASVGTTTYGRPCSDGIYMLKADASDAGFATGGKDWTAAGTSAPFKSTIGEDDHLYVIDYSNDLAFEFSSDMSSVTQLIDASNKSGTPGTNSAQYVSAIHVEGTQAAGNRRIYLNNDHYQDTARKGLIRYDLGGNATATPNDKGTQVIGPSYFTYYPMDVARDSAGDWYMCQFRYDPAQAPAISKFYDSAELPINTAAWETPKATPYNGAYGIDVYEGNGKAWVAYGNYYDGWVHIFNMADGSYVGGFHAGNRIRDLAFDIVGNIYTVDNSIEWLRIWSPGDGANSYTTESYFTIVPEPATLLLLGVPMVLARRRRA